ncbi:aldehyde dehydrogenase family protein [Oceanimonas sp. NS1]|nr:aldehyde dehydrogenase family protein [Oceanimonas sp. NS1]
MRASAAWPTVASARAGPSWPPWRGPAQAGDPGAGRGGSAVDPGRRRPGAGGGVGVEWLFSLPGQLAPERGRSVDHPGLAEAFLERLGERLASLRSGRPDDSDTELGPLAKSGQKEWLERQLREAERQGGRIRCGGYLPDEEGWYYPATLIEGQDPAATLFPAWPAGPVSSVLRVADEHGMQALCRSMSPDGIASIWTRDLARGEQLARSLPFDLCRVNPSPYHNSHWPPQSSPDQRLPLKRFSRSKTVLVSA